jgi:hypothetical protein
VDLSIGVEAADRCLHSCCWFGLTVPLTIVTKVAQERVQTEEGRYELRLFQYACNIWPDAVQAHWVEPLHILVDVYVPSIGLALQADGPRHFHKATGELQTRDLLLTGLLQRAGIRVVRLHWSLAASQDLLEKALRESLPQLFRKDTHPERADAAKKRKPERERLSKG